MQAKTILFVIPSLHVGGAESQLSLILPLLQKKGWDITVFLTSGIGELAEQLRAQNIKVIHPKFMSYKRSMPNKLLRLPHMLLSFLRLALYLRKSRPHIVHFTLTEAYLLGGLCCVLLGQKNLIMSRRSLNNYQSKYPLLAKLEHWLHTKMNVIVSNSKTIQQQLATIESVPEHKLSLIYNGINTQRFNNHARNTTIRQQLQLPDSALTFIVVANIIPYKGHATLLQALALITSQLPANWQLLCVGRNSDYSAELITLSQQLNIAAHVHFLGQQKPTIVDRLLAVSNIALCPSYEEGLSNAVIEALAAGLPSIVTDVGGNPEIIDHNETGIVVPSRDIQKLSQAILQLVRDPLLAQRLAIQGKQRVHERFSLESCVDNYHKLYTTF